MTYLNIIITEAKLHHNVLYATLDFELETIETGATSEITREFEYTQQTLQMSVLYDDINETLSDWFEVDPADVKLNENDTTQEKLIAYFK